MGSVVQESWFYYENTLITSETQMMFQIIYDDGFQLTQIVKSLMIK